jgi:tRNA (cmo5U34)-methyltransferase
MTLDRVRDHFEKEAFEYDGLIPRLIPYYMEQNQLIVKLIPFEKSSDILALDLGSGTGVLAYLILKNFPKAKVVVLEIADNMLQACEKNLSFFKDRLILRKGDFSKETLGSGYNIVVSGLAIHHLNDTDKQKLYKRIIKSLNPGGIFLNRDIVLGASRSLTEHYLGLWREYMKANGEDDEKWFLKYLGEDIPASVENQMTWLRKAGFIDVGCHWRHLNFAIFGGRAPDISR